MVKNSPEGEQLAKRAIAMGIPGSRILLTGTVTNTADEASEVRALMDFSGMQRVILVTSSFHMPRAETLFKRAGVERYTLPHRFSLNWSRRRLADFYPKRRRIE